MSLIVEQLAGFRTNDPTLPRLHYDAMVDERTFGMLDFADLTSHPGTNPLEIGAQIRDMFLDGLPASPTTTVPFDGRGVVLDGATVNNNAKVIRLGNNWKLPASVRRFMLLFWARIRLTGYPQSGSGSGNFNALEHRQSSPSSIYGHALRSRVDRAAGTLTDLNYIANGRTVAMTVPDENLHQFAFEYQAVDGGQHALRAYRDKVLIATGSAGAFTAPYPTLDAAVPAVLGYNANDAGSLGSLRGTVYRIALQGFDGAGLTVAEYLAADWDENNARFA
ncbi:MAG: hypothetical protein DI629_12045 [Mesorhizobium amorphae]|nr:MAG: hypothetical protein DI629_12045 [Mesorhizobium amorphae]